MNVCVKIVYYVLHSSYIVFIIANKKIQGVLKTYFWWYVYGCLKECIVCIIYIGIIIQSNKTLDLFKASLYTLWMSQSRFKVSLTWTSSIIYLTDWFRLLIIPNNSLYLSKYISKESLVSNMDVLKTQTFLWLQALQYMKPCARDYWFKKVNIYTALSSLSVPLWYLLKIAQRKGSDNETRRIRYA